MRFYESDSVSKDGFSGVFGVMINHLIISFFTVPVNNSPKFRIHDQFFPAFFRERDKKQLSFLKSGRRAVTGL
jgi:hypothetical protein